MIKRRNQDDIIYRWLKSKSTASLKTLTEKLVNMETLGFILLLAGILFTGITILLGTITLIFHGYPWRGAGSTATADNCAFLRACCTPALIGLAAGD